MRNSKFRFFVPTIVLASCFAISGCNSHHIDSTIENRTGGPIHQVEVSYPSASFGIDTLTPGQIYPYRFQVRSEGAMKVQYTDSTGKQIMRQGPHVAEGDRGQYLIILQRDGIVDWEPSLTK